MLPGLRTVGTPAAFMKSIAELASIGAKPRKEHQCLLLASPDTAEDWIGPDVSWERRNCIEALEKAVRATRS